MKKINKEKLLEIYDYYRDASLPLGLILVCLFLILFVLLPQLMGSLNNKGQYELEKGSLQVLKDNFSYISVLDSTSLEEDLGVVSQAIPPQADFDAIISSIYYAAASSGMSMGQFQFSVNQEMATSDLPFVTVTLKVNSGSTETLAFIKELYKTFPASRISVIRIEEKIKEVTAYFYYKPLLTRVENNSVPVPKLTPSDEEILRSLSDWRSPESAFAPTVSSTSSGALGSDFPF